MFQSEGKRALHIEMPMTGKAKRKTIYNWLTYCYEEVTVIELGCRETAPGEAFRQRVMREYRPPLELLDDAPDPRDLPSDRDGKPPKPGTRRAAVHDYIRAHGPATATELATHLKTARESVPAALHNDGWLRRVNARPGKTGRIGAGEEHTRWTLKEAYREANASVSR